MRNVVVLGAVLSLFGPLTAAAPVPKETSEQQLARLFGTPVDPNKDCAFAFDGKKLTVRAGKGDHAMSTGGRTAAPRTLREVEGDFTVEVTAAPGERPPEAKPAMAGRGLKFYSQGLLLWVGDGTFIRFEHAHVDRLNGKVDTYASWELFTDGEWTRAGSLADGALDDAKPTRLRLARKGNAVRGAWSQDGGTTWKELEALNLDLKAKVRVGVIVNHNTDSPYSATFEGFSITPAGAARK